MIPQNRLSFITTVLAFILSFYHISFLAAGESKTDSTALTLKGKVVDAATTQNITDAQISIPAQGISTISDEEGKFRLKNVPSGMHTVKAEADGYKVWEKEMTLEEDTEFIIKLERDAQ